MHPAPSQWQMHSGGVGLIGWESEMTRTRRFQTEEGSLDRRYRKWMESRDIPHPQATPHSWLSHCVIIFPAFKCVVLNRCTKSTKDNGTAQVRHVANMDWIPPGFFTLLITASVCR